MTEPLAWLDDGTPFSPRFGDRYHSSANHGLDQARHVFLHGNGLPAAWAGQARWRILETGFGLGLNFLVTWAAWRADPARPQVLHFTSVEAHPVNPADLLRATPPDPALQPLAQELAAKLWGLLPGVHRISMEAGRVMLTLWIGDAHTLLRQQTTTADSIYLDGFSPRLNPSMWSADTLRALTRHCRTGTTLATWCVAADVRRHLTQLGFAVEKVPGTPPKRHNLRGRYQPAWQPRGQPTPAPFATPGSALIIGAGLAGAAAARSLALRGWQVRVLDAADQPATAASGLPGGLLCPSTSRDDNPLSRLIRSGVRTTLQRLHDLCTPDVDWAATDVLEHLVDGKIPLPPHWYTSASPTDIPTDTNTPPQSTHSPTSNSAYHPAHDWSQPAPPALCIAAGLPPDTLALQHRAAAWVRPARLVQAQLQHPHITWQGHSPVAALRAIPAPPQHPSSWRWQALDAHGHILAEADIALIAAGAGTPALLPPYPHTSPATTAATPAAWPLRPLRGQVTIGTITGTGTAASLPAIPVNGHGNFLPRIPQPDGAPPLWVMGSTFERGIHTLPVPASEQHTAHAANWGKLRQLLPATAAALEHAFTPGHPLCGPTWAGVRCVCTDRLPLVGEISTASAPDTGPLPAAAATTGPNTPPGLWVIGALGARGLALSVLCGELIAARLMGEPLPLEDRLAERLCPRRSLPPLPPA